MARRRPTRRRRDPSCVRQWARCRRILIAEIGQKSPVLRRCRSTVSSFVRVYFLLHIGFVVLQVLIMNPGRLRTKMITTNAKSSDDALKTTTPVPSLTMNFHDENNFEVLDEEDILTELHRKFKELQQLRKENEEKMEEDKKEQLEEIQHQRRELLNMEASQKKSFERREQELKDAKRKLFFNIAKQQQQLDADDGMEESNDTESMEESNLETFDEDNMFNELNKKIIEIQRLRVENKNKMEHDKKKQLEEIEDHRQELLILEVVHKKSFERQAQELEAAQRELYFEKQEQLSATEQTQDEVSVELPDTNSFGAFDENDVDDDEAFIAYHERKKFSLERQNLRKLFEIDIFGKCIDEDDFACNDRADAGACATKPDIMHSRCPRSCLLCPDQQTLGQPQDDNAWRSRALEEDLLIDFEADSTSDCADVEELCPFWEEEHFQCEANPEYMHRNCMKTCDLCPIPNSRSRSEAVFDTAVVYGTGYWFFVQGERQILAEPEVEETRRRILETMEYLRDEVVPNRKYDKVRDKCVNTSENCAMWAVMGECEKNRGPMVEACAPSCKTCHLLVEE